MVPTPKRNFRYKGFMESLALLHYSSGENSSVMHLVQSLLCLPVDHQSFSDLASHNSSIASNFSCLHSTVVELFMWICVCMYICMYACMCLCMYVYVYLWICMCVMWCYIPCCAWSLTPISKLWGHYWCSSRTAYGSRDWILVHFMKARTLLLVRSLQAL